MNSYFSSELDSGWGVFIRKPRVIKARQMNEYFEVTTSEGILKGKPGDYLIIEEGGELNLCREEKFKKNYVKYSRKDKKDDKET
ncbi:PGDYG domain-containing protein [Halothermothrix orenii]|uniref:Uncharacterized protein n=1 Tax=Halothermothrix orenii (strain H 168 / OCM 544 / DSM 9562) TaxID=373903 RepID=B8CYE1_HALOH|nr:PGDYG domain-containing protein [Halothermothrix orenii]ACL70310.1 hypothetical protein Hore_15610 [Halothermothrix orenii H 168]